jgi:aspartate racemase
MKTIDELLSELNCLKVKLWSDGEHLCYEAPNGTLTPTLLTQLREHKTEILTFLHNANTATHSNLPPILPVPRDKDLPLSFAQQRLWFIDQLEPKSSAYNIPADYRLTGQLNITALEQSLNKIIQRHEVLRTTFPSVDGQPSQAIAPTITLSIPLTDLREHRETEREAIAQQLATEEAKQSFDLASDQLFRAKLLHLTEGEYVLLLTMHHVVYDGWSYDIFFRELATLYDAFSSGKPSPIPKLSIQYADFAHWQRNWLQGEVLESQLNYWKQQLSGSLPILQLPTDYQRPPVQTHPGVYQSLELSQDLTAALKALSQQEGVTLFMTLLATFQTLLSRYSGQEDIIVGTPIAGRNQVEAERLIGLFVNTLALRTNLSGNPTFRQLLNQVREVTLAAYEYQDLPFEKLIEELNPERDLSRSPLFQVMFAFQNTPSQPWELPGLTITPLEVHSRTSKFDLTLDLRETSEGTKGGIEYNTDLFEATTITRMLGHFQTLLESIVANPEQHLWDLPLLTTAEQNQLLVEWNNTTTDYPNNTCIHQLFEAQVEQTPNAIAVVFQNQQLTYQQLNQRANQLAHHLQKLGVKPEVTVGICLERSVEMLIAILAILKAGGAYIPLDPTYPQERLTFMLQDSQLSLLLTTSKIVHNSLYASAKASPNRIDNNQQSPINPEQLTVICLDKTWKTINQENPENPKSNAKTTNLAYIIYTSGSTGNPKGVQITHQSLTNFLQSMLIDPGLKSEDILLAVTSISFDIAALELYLPLLIGAKLVIASTEVAADGQQLLKAIDHNQVTVMQATPATWQMLLQAGWNSSTANVKKILCGGEALSKELARELLSKSDSVWNLYGPTETTIWSTIYYLEALPNHPGSSITIGRPIANTKIYILDSHLKALPIGVPGELYIGGTGLARGYLNRPKLTREKFIPNPFEKSKDNRLYKTGDLARYRSDGTIEFIGRIDNQVKIRGFRIELGELEMAIAQHPNIEQTVVIAREDNPGDKQLVAYIVPHPEQALTTDELCRFLKQKLPDYMLPRAFVFLDTLPLTPNGKIDRRALPVPDNRRQEPEKTFIAPRDELELKLAHIWEKILDIQPIGMKDNFFNLGGYSLLAVRLFSQIEKELRHNIPLATLFQAPTIEQLASVIRKKEWSAQWRSLVPIQPLGLKTPLFCVHALGPSVLYYQNLALHLGLDRPFYGLQAQGLDGKQPPLTKIEDMAAYYIKEIQTIQPEGDYLIGGSSFGGKVALEIAQQLIAKGQTVALLVLFDSTAPGCFTRIPVNQRISHHFDNFLQLGPNYILKKITGKFQWIKNITKERIQRASFKFSQKHITSFAQTHPNQIVERANKQAAREYVPQIYPGKVALFRAINQSAPEGWSVDPKRGWGKLASGELEVYEVPGGHNSMFREPHVRMLAEKLRVSINNATAKKVTS